MGVEFIGKSVLITEESHRTLAVSDLHLGYGGSLRKGGIFLRFT